MCHKNCCLSLFFDDLSDIITDVQPRLVVESGERLVKQQKIRLHRQCTDQCRSLPHTAGKLGRAGIGKGFQAVCLHHLPDFFFPLGCQRARNLKAQQNVAVDGPPFKQVVSLQHVADMEIRLRDRPSAAQQSSRLRL